jgi:uncharacterized membrane protein (DUF373 family)
VKPERESDEILIIHLKKAIRVVVRILAVLMTGVIIWGVADVMYVLYNRLITPPVGLLEISDILATFGAFMAVLIAIEIFINITLYLREEVIALEVVLATALMAISRKIIVLDYKEVAPSFIWASAGVILALALAYYLAVKLRTEKAGSILG